MPTSRPSDEASPLPGRTARLATVATLRTEIFARYLNPLPNNRTLRKWMRAARIPSLQSNPHAKNGGGEIWWSVVAVEAWLRKRAGDSN